MKRTKAFLAALLLSIAGITSLHVGQALAATCTWTGATNDNFNTAANWSGCGSGVPQNGDSITFNIANLTADKTLNNDISSLSVATITYNGANASGYTYHIGGNGITITSGVVANANVSLQVPVTLGASQTWSGTGYINVGKIGATRSIAMGSSNLTIAANNGLLLFGALSGSGNLISNGDVQVSESSGSWTGNTSVGSNGSVALFKANSLGSSGTITVANGGSLGFCGLNGDTVTNPISVQGSGEGFGAILSFPGCGMGGSGDTSPAKAVLSGAITLTGDTVVRAADELKITGTLSGNYTLTLASGSTGTLVIASSNNTSKTPNGSSQAPPQTTTVEKGDNQPNTYVVVGKNQIYVINGVRGDTTVDSGGTLKGTGTVGALTISGSLAPGLSPGCLNSGNLVLNPSATYEFELGGKDACTGYDQMKVSGTVQAGGSLALSLFNGFKPVRGQVYTIIDNDGNDAVTGTFNNLAEGATFTVGGYVFKVSYAGGSGNDVTLTVMNVPASPDTGFGMIQANPVAAAAAMAAAGGALLFLARRAKPAKATRSRRR